MITNGLLMATRRLLQGYHGLLWGYYGSETLLFHLLPRASAKSFEWRGADTTCQQVPRATEVPQSGFEPVDQGGRKASRATAGLGTLKIF